VVSIGVAALLALPMAVGDFGAFRDATRAAANPPGTVKPLDIWFPFADPAATTVRLPDGSSAVAYVRTMPHALDRATHWIIIGVCAALIVLWWRRGGRGGGAGLLLALLLLLRVVLDPRAHAYHHAPFVLALATAEATFAARFPWRTLVVSGLLAVSLRMFDSASWTATNVVHLVWAVPAAALLAATAFGVTRRIPGARALR
jgi:hypothetical protein